MNTRKFILQETLILLIGEVLCSAAMVGVFALADYFSLKVIWGALFGIVLAVGNFLFMAIFSESAADKAADQDVKGGKDAIKASYGLRMVVLGVLLFVLLSYKKYIYVYMHTHICFHSRSIPYWKNVFLNVFSQ